jgi:N-methylhydantoinase A
LRLGAHIPGVWRVRGPAVVEHPETTVYIGPGQSARLDDAGNLSIDLH